MKKTILFIAILFAVPCYAGKAPDIANCCGFISIEWVFDKQKENLYETWAALNSKAKLKGPVSEFLDWDNVSKIIVIYNLWHLPLMKKDIRLQHIEENLGKAVFGDKFKGQNPGGTYILLLQYRDSDREVLLSFTGGIFIIESKRGIGVVDTRGTH